MSKKFSPDYRSSATEALHDAVEKRLRSSDLAPAPTPSPPGESPAIPGGRQVEAWFLGPRAENAELFEKLVVDALRDHVFWRRNFHPEDPSAITPHTKRDPGYLQAVDTLQGEFDILLAELKKSAPFFSMRYQGHMTWDQTLPGMAGYFAAMMYNQNNVALEASPVTTILEARAGEALCRMLGLREHGDIKPWGHLTCGGTTANIEAMWAARNLKFYPLSLQAAIRAKKTSELDVLEDLRVTLPSGRDARLMDLDAWQVLNLGVDEVLGLPARIELQHSIKVKRLNQLVSDYTLQDLGLVEFTRNYLGGVKAPVFLVPGSKHYSLPKAAAILGLGADHMYSIPLDADGRMDVTCLREALEKCLNEQRPVIAVVAVLGTTEEGLVDPLSKVLSLRDDLRSKDMEFCVHADAAWGGYFASLLREPSDGMQVQAAGPTPTGAPAPSPTPAPTPALSLSTYVTEQYESLPRADTVTLDPHKTGYLPYPAGAICYRNRAMRSLVAFEAPYINTADDKNDVIVGKYGVEGSKPGAAAAGVYLSHQVIPPDQHGYGQILGRTLYNCKLFHAYLLLMNKPSEPFEVVPGPRFLPDSIIQKQYGNRDKALEHLRRVVESKKGASFAAASKEDLALLREIGADLNIITYAFNFKINGVLNTSMAHANLFNRKIYERLGIKGESPNIYGYKLLVSTTDFVKADYGKKFFEDYQQRLLGTATPGDGDSEGVIAVLRSVIMDPWIAEDLHGRPFIETIMHEMRAAVLDVLAQLQASGDLPR